MKKHQLVVFILMVLIIIAGLGRYVVLWYMDFGGPACSVPAFDFRKMGVSEADITRKSCYSNGIDTICLEVVNLEKSESREVHRISGISPAWQVFKMQMQSPENDTMQIDLTFSYVYTELDTLPDKPFEYVLEICEGKERDEKNISVFRDNYRELLELYEERDLSVNHLRLVKFRDLRNRDWYLIDD